MSRRIESEPIAEIAALLRTDESTARRFAEEVQKLLPSLTPSFAVIADCVRTQTGGHVSVRQVADALRSRGYGAAYVDWLGHVHGREGSRSFGSADGEEIEPSVPPGPRHDPRAATDGMDKCPHGVLMIRPCAICGRGTFADWD